MWGRGPCKHTPYITVKNKAGAGLLLCQRPPGAKAWRGGSFPPHPHTQRDTQGPGTPLRPGPGVHGRARLTPKRAHTLTHTLTYTHTPKHTEPINATVIQRQWWGLGGIAQGRCKKGLQGRKGWDGTGNHASAHQRVGAGARDRADARSQLTSLRYQ